MTQNIKKLFASTALIIIAASFNVVPAAAQQTPKPGAHAGHNHGAGNTDENLSPIDYVFSEAPDDHAIGDAKADHTLIVYASVVCGHCGRWFEDDYPIIKQRLIDTGQLRLVFREFPTQPADIAFMGFQVANCAAPEDYFDAIVYQFQTQKETFEKLRSGEGRARFLEISNKAGLETEDDMLACFESEEGKARIETSMKRAQSGKIDAVPALILDGTLMPGLNGAKEVLAALGESTDK